MAFTNYTIVPEDEVVVLDGTAYQHVDMSGIPTTVHAITWSGTTSTGRIQYKILPSGVLPAPTSFSDPEDYFAQTEACVSPTVVYAEENGFEYNGVTYQAGEQINIYTYPALLTDPAGTTSVDPGSIPPFYLQNQWTGTAWVTASFPYNYTLSQAKIFLTSLVNTNASSLVAFQLRNYSPLQVVLAVDPSLFLPADSVTNLYPTIGDYQSAVDSEIAPQLAFINAATNVSQLYDFNPTVDEPPVY